MSLFDKALNIGKAKISAATAGIHSLLDSIQGLPTPSDPLSKMIEFLHSEQIYVDAAKINTILGQPADDESSVWSRMPGNLRNQLLFECTKNISRDEHMVSVIVFGLMAEYWDAAGMEYELPKP